jgi:DNA end-binding protein Ku
MYAATDNKSVSMRQLHAECHTPIKYNKVCPACETELEQNDIIKGYEYNKGQFVVLEDEELQELAHQKSRNIEIMDFIELKEVDPIYFNRSYYLGPHEHGEKAYTLLKKTMQDTSKIAVAKVVMRSKEHLAALRVYDGALVMETLHYPDEIRQTGHIPGLNEDVDVNEQELSMAKQLVEQLTTAFEPEKYKDEYRDNVMELVESKVSGDEVKIAKEVPKADITNLMDALQASLHETKPKTGRKTAAKKETKSS